MSKDKSETEGKKKGGLIVKLLMGLGLIGAGGGGAFALVQTGVVGGGSHKKEDNTPKLIRKGETDPFAPKTDDKESAAVAEVHGDGGSQYATSYYSFTDDFTSNLKNSDALLQVSLACSTRRDGRVLMWVRKHELAIRSSMLEVLADTPEGDVYTMPGKENLRKRLTAAINKVLTDAEGFGGVDDVYFRTFIIQ